MVMAAMVPRYTAAEVREFPDDRLRYEVVRGELFVSPAPGLPHQRIVLEFARLLAAYVEAHGLGEAFVGPFEVEFTEDSATQPDVLVVLNDRAHRLTRKRVEGAPSLIVEVVSYSSKRTDRLQKRLLYLEEGVDEYWVVDPEQRRVERWVEGAERPELIESELTWKPARGPALRVDLVALFEKAWR